jgi:hypothetical protein
MAASHSSLDSSEPTAVGTALRAAETERPPAAPTSLATAASDARLQAALSATSRADASLSTLMRAVRELTNGVSNAREANVALVGELGALADLLGAANERQLALRNRVLLLEQALERAEKEAVSERSYILEQQDSFIAGMLDEHERVVAELRREVDGPRERLSQRPTATPGTISTFEAATAQTLVAPLATASPVTDRDESGRLRDLLETARKEIEGLIADRERTRETLLKLQAQRDEAQAAVVRLTRERDLARAEGAQNRIGNAVRQAIPVHTPTPTPAGRMASTLPPPDSPRAWPPPSSPQHAVPSAKPPSNRKRTTDPAGAPADKSTRTTAPQPIGVQRPKAPSLDLAPREQRIPSPPPEELRAALHPPTTPLPPPPVLTPAPVTPRGLGEIPVPTAPPVASKKPKLDSSMRPTGGYSVTNSVEPEHVNTSSVSRRPPRR